MHWESCSHAACMLRLNGVLAARLIISLVFSALPLEVLSASLSASKLDLPAKVSGGEAQAAAVPLLRREIASSLEADEQAQGHPEYDLALGLTPFASSVGEGTLAQLTDGDPSTAWHSVDGEGSSFVMLDLGVSSKINKIKVHSSADSRRLGFQSLKLYRSNDGVEWTMVRHERLENCEPGRQTVHAGWKEFTQYVKMDLSDRCNGAQHFAIASFQVLGYAVGTITTTTTTTTQEPDTEDEDSQPEVVQKDDPTQSWNRSQVHAQNGGQNQPAAGRTSEAQQHNLPHLATQNYSLPHLAMQNRSLPDLATQKHSLPLLPIDSRSTKPDKLKAIDSRSAMPDKLEAIDSRSTMQDTLKNMAKKSNNVANNTREESNNVANNTREGEQISADVKANSRPTAMIESAACHLPAFQSYVTRSFKCPVSGEVKCLDEGLAYPTLAAAWVACGQMTTCRGIVRDGAAFYVNRLDQPECDVGQSDCTALQFLVYSCKSTRAAMAGQTQKSDWQCNAALSKRLVPQFPCSLSEHCVSTIDECATLASNDPHCGGSINYFGDDDGPSGAKPGECRCVLTDQECGGSKAAGGKIAQAVQFTCGAPSLPAYVQGSFVCEGLEQEACFNDNQAYHSLDSAWDACSRISGCSLVVNSGFGDAFYLRTGKEKRAAEGRFVVYSCSQSKWFDDTGACDDNGGVTHCETKWPSGAGHSHCLEQARRHNAAAVTSSKSPDDSSHYCTLHYPVGTTCSSVETKGLLSHFWKEFAGAKGHLPIKSGNGLGTHAVRTQIRCYRNPEAYDPRLASFRLAISPETSILIQGEADDDDKIRSFIQGDFCSEKQRNFGWCGHGPVTDQALSLSGSALQIGDERSMACKSVVEVDAKICPSRQANLVRVRGLGAGDLARVDGCTYDYHAQYECTAPAEPHNYARKRCGGALGGEGNIYDCSLSVSVQDISLEGWDNTEKRPLDMCKAFCDLQPGCVGCVESNDKWSWPVHTRLHFVACDTALSCLKPMSFFQKQAGFPSQIVVASPRTPKYNRKPCSADGGEFDCTVEGDFKTTATAFRGWSPFGKTLEQCEEFCDDASDCKGCAHSAEGLIWPLHNLKVSPCSQADFVGGKCATRLNVFEKIDFVPYELLGQGQCLDAQKRTYSTFERGGCETIDMCVAACTHFSSHQCRGFTFYDPAGCGRCELRMEDGFFGASAGWSFVGKSTISGGLGEMTSTRSSDVDGMYCFKRSHFSKWHGSECGSVDGRPEESTSRLIYQTMTIKECKHICENEKLCEGAQFVSSGLALPGMEQAGGSCSIWTEPVMRGKAKSGSTCLKQMSSATKARHWRLLNNADGAGCNNSLWAVEELQFYSGTVKLNTRKGQNMAFADPSSTTGAHYAFDAAHGFDSSWKSMAGAVAHKGNSFIGYTFDYPVNLNRFRIKQQGSCGTTSVKVQYSHNSRIWNTAWVQDLVNLHEANTRGGGGVVVTGDGMDFDCRAGVANLERGWSEEKKKFCCNKDGIGCSGAKQVGASFWQDTSGAPHWRLLNDADDAGCVSGKNFWRIKELEFYHNDVKLPTSDTTSAPFAESSLNGTSPGTVFNSQQATSSVWHSSYWSSEAGAMRLKGKSYIGYTFPMPVSVNRFRLLHHMHCGTTSVKVQYSTDMVNWNTAWIQNLPMIRGEESKWVDSSTQDLARR